MKNQNFIKLISISGLVLMLTLSATVFAQPIIPDITGVKEVSINLACRLTLVQGDKASISITGDKEALEDVEVKMNGEKLKVYNECRNQRKSDVYITLTLPDLKVLSIGGAVELITPEPVRYEDLTVDVTGVADFKMKVKSKLFRMSASGVLSGEIVGETGNLKMDISGVGKLDASNFKSVNCKIEVSGVARIAVYAEERLDASVSGMGKISYAGKPVVNANSSGIGRISRL